MDWMKTEILIAVRNNIAKEAKLPYVCNNIKEEFLAVYSIYLNDERLHESFKEFFDLFDGKFWTSKYYMPVLIKDNTSWWDSSEIEARLNILDFIIANRSM